MIEIFNAIEQLLRSIDLVVLKQNTKETAHDNSWQHQEKNNHYLIRNC